MTMHFGRTATFLSVGLLAAGGALAEDKPGEGVTIRPIEGTLLEERFQNQIIYRALQELGYSIGEPQTVEYQTIHLAIGSGDGDFTTVHYDPLHEAFFEESGGDAVMRRVGHLIKGAVQGYLVDKASYDAGVTNIGDLKDPEVAKRFDANGDGTADLAGCPPGWGCELIIEHQLDAYGLRDTVAHNQGAYSAIIGESIAREEADEPIIYYTWTPYWVSGVLIAGENVEWLEVPETSLPEGQTGNTEFEGRNLGWPVNELRILASSEFLDANPAAEKLFELAEIEIKDISAQNNRMQLGEDSITDIDSDVDDWIADNQEAYDSWIVAARDAAQ